MKMKANSAITKLQSVGAMGAVIFSIALSILFKKQD